MIHGIPIRVLMVNEEGKEEPEWVYMASCRKHPKLNEIIKKISTIEKKEATAHRQLLLAVDKLDKAEETNADADVETVVDEIQKFSDQVNDYEVKRLAEVQALYLEAMKAAGYTEEDIDKYFYSLDPDRYKEVVNRLLVGCGRLDFFTEPNPQEQS